VLTEKGRLKKRQGVQNHAAGISFGPSLPAGVKDGNWIQTMPGKGNFVCLLRQKLAAERC
jgi:hypothetical protein